MKTALVISSYVAASRVGATASAFCLRRLGVDTIVIPTTVLGRHPGWGTPGGQALNASHLLNMWTAIKAQNIKIDAVMTGYLADDDHIDIAAAALMRLSLIYCHWLTLSRPMPGSSHISQASLRLILKTSLRQSQRWTQPAS